MRRVAISAAFLDESAGRENMDVAGARAEIARAWNGDVLSSLADLVRIPAVSAAYDPGWESAGHLRAAVDHVRAWIEAQRLPGVQCEILCLPGRSPLLYVDVPATTGATATGSVLLYGHLDKQPAHGDWSAGLGPWLPVVREGRLYGRGAVDDGYAAYAATTALTALRATGGDHARTVLLLETGEETGEESGSPDLAAYLDHLADRLGDITLVLCLDAGGRDHERLWLTSSLRGAIMATLTVRVSGSSLHSGIAGGIVPSSFRVMRQLLDRLEDSATGRIAVPEFHAPIPAERRAEALAARHPGIAAQFPLLPGVRPEAEDDVELILHNTWRPALSVVGAAGLPDAAEAGAVLHASTTLRLCFRIPPAVDARAAYEALVAVLTTDVPHGAHVDVTDPMLINGWSAPAPASWLSDALGEVGDHIFGNPCAGIGIDGGIPFMELLGRRCPDAQFVATGALGPDSNLHVPDEWLDLRFAGQLTAAIALIVNAHATAD
ncbi:M20/M25/M40 family metallo-hydrolase [Actinoplanes sp. RD1]|uniref:M20/M25/M40 family metallo-hydrolase n=1 Tax=Actinoplanes sp. RD1 TaxID=3064538 RepID=UPI0027424098|nr:M20/M25/M40 family metallo-hydrolase [Actinoplanes sp. RD1]